MIRTQIYLTESQHKKIKSYIHDKDMTLASYVRDAVDEKLEEKKAIESKKKKKEKTFSEELKESIKNIKGIYSNGPKDLASNVDKYLYGK